MQSKIIFVLENDIFFHNLFLQRLIKKRKNKLDFLHVLEFVNNNNKLSFYKNIKKNIFIISKYQIIKGLIILFIWYVNNFFNRTSSIEKTCKKNSIKHIKIDNDLNKNYIIIKKINPKLILNASALIFNEKVINASKYGVLNKHCGELPKYRGSFPVFYSLLAAEKNITITFNKISLKLDEGPILISKKFPIKKDSLFKLYLKAYIYSSYLANKIIKEKKYENINSYKKQNSTKKDFSLKMPTKNLWKEFYDKNLIFF